MVVARSSPSPNEHINSPEAADHAELLLVAAEVTQVTTDKHGNYC